MESTFATEMSDSQQAQLNAILDRCLADPELGALKSWMDRYVPREFRT